MLLHAVMVSIFKINYQSDTGTGIILSNYGACMRFQWSCGQL